MTAAFEAFEYRVQTAGLQAVQHTVHHWQIRGGHVIVNYYPSKRTAYVNGTTKGIKGVGEREAIELAQRGPRPGSIRGDKRRKRGYKAERRRLLRINPACHWCNAPLDEGTATLDHKVALSRGGANQRDNFVLACHGCNQGRGNRVGPPPGSGVKS